MGYAGLRSIIIQIGGDLDILKGEKEMIELHVKEYCKNCTEFEPETQTYINETYDFKSGLEAIVSANTSVTCKHAQRCECIREFIEKEIKKEQEKHD